MINIDDIVERDVDRCGNYITLNYEFPFSDLAVIREREDEEFRYQTRKNPLIAFS